MSSGLWRAPGGPRDRYWESREADRMAARYQRERAGRQSNRIDTQGSRSRPETVANSYSEGPGRSRRRPPTFDNLCHRSLGPGGRDPSRSNDPFSQSSGGRGRDRTSPLDEPLRDPGERDRSRPFSFDELSTGGARERDRRRPSTLDEPFGQSSQGSSRRNERAVSGYSQPWNDPYDRSRVPESRPGMSDRPNRLGTGTGMSERRDMQPCGETIYSGPAGDSSGYLSYHSSDSDSDYHYGFKYDPELLAVARERGWIDPDWYP